MIKEKEYTRVHKTYTTNTIGKATQERTQKTTLSLSLSLSLNLSLNKILTSQQINQRH